MGEVTIVSSSIIQPQNISQPVREKIHLTPFDLNLLYIDYPQRGLFFPKPDPETRFISRLKTSLSSALDIYFPFAGRLGKVNNLEDNTVSFHIDCNNFGVMFVHALAESVSVSDILKPNGSVPEIFSFFFPLNGVKNIEGDLKPLLALQVTEIKDGVFIGFGYNHMIADGASIWNFFNTWSKICSNGQRANLQPLVLRGWFLDKIDFPIHIPVSEIETVTSPLSHEVSSPAMEHRVFHFTKKNLTDLKSKVNSSRSDQNISSLQAVTAHMWRSIIRYSCLNREEETRYTVAVDLRQRLNPPLDKECFGDVIYNATVTTTVGELQDCGLRWAGLQINKMLRSLTNKEYDTFAEDWVKNVRIQKSGLVGMGSGIVGVSSSHRFEVYDNDFGWGKPITARAGPNNRYSGRLVIFRGIEEGSIDVHATVWSDLLVKLLADVEFMEHVDNI